MSSGEEQRDLRAGEILDAALKLPADQIEQFIAAECGPDTELLSAVHGRLDALHTVYSAAAAGMSRPPAASTEKTSQPTALSHYRIREKIGQGGMGAVYLAVDTHLDRLVAVKVLPPKSVRDPDRRRRFEREAKAISALSHPNIVSVYDFGSTADGDYIAMEYVKGPTLEQVLAAGRPALDDAFNYARQTAAAISAAHAGGVIHRDIKPANIMLGHDGQIKVLDFGLAKLTQPRDSLLNSPGENAAPEDALKTIAGTIAGTVNYMSPEQAEGKAVDVRSDIFSFGAVLYELVTGRKAFQGDSHISVLSKILHANPPRASQRAEGVSSSLENLICRCIEKDPARRYQTMDDVVAALESAERGEEIRQLPPAGGVEQPNRLRARWTAFAGLAAAILIAILVWNSRHPETPPPLPLPVPFTTYRGTESQPVFSPDGGNIAFIWDGDNGLNNDVYVKAVAGGAPVRLTTDPGREHSPAWSPDGSVIAFCRAAGGQHRILAIPNGGEGEAELGVSIADGVSFGMDWRPDGKFLAIVDRGSATEPNAIFLLDAGNGEKKRLTNPPASSAGDNFPAYSPDGKRLAFLRFVDANRRMIYIVDLANGNETPIESDASAGLAWTTDGRELIYSSWRLGLERVSATGSSHPRTVPVGDERAYYPAISKNGNRLAYSRWIHNTNIWRANLPGADSLPAKQSGNVKWISSTRRQDSPSISPDLKHIAFVSDRSGYNEIWLAEADGGNAVQLTTFAGPNTGTPRWSPSGELIAFDSRPAGNADIFVISPDGGEPRPVTTDPSQDFVPSWSGDGRSIYFASDRSGERQIWKASLDGGEPAQITRNGGFEAFESADGAYLYYTPENNRSGIWRVPAGGGEESPVAGLEGAAKSRYWALTPSGIYFVPTEFSEQVSDVVEVRFFEFATGRILHAAAFGHMVSGPSGLAVPRDAQFLLYAQEDQSDRDIVLVENFH